MWSWILFSRRCDGQGHILSGILAAFLHWGLSSSSSLTPSGYQAIDHLAGSQKGLHIQDTDEVDAEVYY